MIKILLKIILRIFFDVFLALLLTYFFNKSEIGSATFYEFSNDLIWSATRLTESLFHHVDLENNENYGKYIAEVFAILLFFGLIQCVRNIENLLKHIATSLKKEDVDYSEDIDDIW